MKENTTLNPAPRYLALELPPRHQALVAFEVGLAFLIDITALLGNILVCYAVYRNTRLRTVTNYSIVSLAVSDLAFAVVCLPFSIGVLIEGRWIFGTFLCALHAYMSNCLACVSVITLSFTAVNRYCKVARPVACYRRHFTKRKALCFTVAIWLVVFCAMSVILAAEWAVTEFSAQKAICAMVYKNDLASLVSFISVVVIFLAIPWILAVVCYLCVYKAVRRHRMATNPGSRPRLGLSVEDINVNRTLFAVITGFSICWLPVLFIAIVYVFDDETRSSRYMNMIFSYMGALSSAINPVIYGAMNKAFRNEFRKILMPCRVDANQQHVVP